MNSVQLRSIIRFNKIFGISFIVFKIIMIFCFNLCFDAREDPHIPYTLTEYEEKGGSPIHYVCGYLFYTSNVSVNRTPKDKWRLDLRGRTVVRQIYLIAYFFIWIYSFVALLHIYDYRVFEECRDPFKKLQMEKSGTKFKKPTEFDCFMATAVSFMTTYLVIYSFKYCISYFLK